MRKIISYTILSFTILAGVLAFKINNSLPIGSDLPKGDTQLQNVSGKEITMKSAKDKNGLLVMFSCNSCPYVIKNQSRTKAICSYALQNNIGVVLINSNEAHREGDESLAAMKEYANEQHYNWPYTIDKNSGIADAFGASRTPECFLFNKDLKLTYHGAIDDSPSQPANVEREHLKEAINEMVAGKKVSVTETRSVGCSIKRR